MSSPTVIRSGALKRDESAEDAELLTPTLPRWVETEPNRNRFSPVGISMDQPIFLPMCPSCLRRIDGRLSGDLLFCVRRCFMAGFMCRSIYRTAHRANISGYLDGVRDRKSTRLNSSH